MQPLRGDSPKRQGRLIVDLSSPAGGSVNDGISKELSSLSYMAVDDVMEKVLELGKGARMAKADIRQAYRNIPVYPDDRGLLGVQWQGQLLVDGCLPFGLRSAPLLFTVAADLLQWVMSKRGVTWIRHYIDDFITLGAEGKEECGKGRRPSHRVGVPGHGAGLGQPGNPAPAR